MNIKEIGELRRRWAYDKNCAGTVYGCYVNGEKQVISKIAESSSLFSQNDAEKYFSLFKKTLSGTPERNLLSLSFSTSQVSDSEEHRILTALRNSDCNDEAARNALYERIMNVLTLDSNYLILLCSDTYDVPFRKGDSARLDSEQIFRYFICCVCPVRDGKAELGYFSEEKAFRSSLPPQHVCSPVLGFTFPCFDDRRANIYSTLFYTKDAGTSHEGIIASLFNMPAPMPAAAQMDTFSEVLADALGKDCSFEVVRSVHGQIRERIEEYKESKDPEPMDFTARDVASMLRDSGVAEETVATFEEKCEESFGHDAPLTPANIVNVKKFEVRTPAVRISVDPDAATTIETRVIDRRKYILIPADNGVEINGLNVKTDRNDSEINT